MHATPTARTEDFQQYGFIHMDMGHRGWARICTSARGRERQLALAATTNHLNDGLFRPEPDSKPAGMQTKHRNSRSVCLTGTRITARCRAV